MAQPTETDRLHAAMRHAHQNSAIWAIILDAFAPITVRGLADAFAVGSGRFGIEALMVNLTERQLQATIYSADRVTNASLQLPADLQGLWGRTE